MTRFQARTCTRPRPRPRPRGGFSWAAARDTSGHGPEKIPPFIVPVPALATNATTRQAHTRAHSDSRTHAPWPPGAVAHWPSCAPSPPRAPSPQPHVAVAPPSSARAPVPALTDVWPKLSPTRPAAPKNTLPQAHTQRGLQSVHRDDLATRYAQSTPRRPQSRAAQTLDPSPKPQTFDRSLKPVVLTVESSSHSSEHPHLGPSPEHPHLRLQSVTTAGAPTPETPVRSRSLNTHT